MFSSTNAESGMGECVSEGCTSVKNRSGEA